LPIANISSSDLDNRSIDVYSLYIKIKRPFSSLYHPQYDKQEPFPY